MATIIFYGQFIESKVGKNSLTVTVDVERITRSDGTRSALVTGASATEVTRRGLYYYRLTDADLTLYDYVATFITTNTDVDQREIAALWTLYSISWHDIATSIMTVVGSIGKLLVDMLDAAISTRATAANQTTILARIGSFTGSGVNTILGFLKAVMSKAASTPSDVGGTFSASTDSTEALRDGLPAAVWANSTRTLTQSAASVAATVSGDTITLSRGDTLSASITGLGSLSGYVSLDFTVKYTEDDTDAEAVIRIRKNASGSDDGLLRLNGADASSRSTNGSITIDDSDSGDITIALAAAESDDLVDGSYFYDIQEITSSAVSTLSAGTFVVAKDVTRLIS